MYTDYFIALRHYETERRKQGITQGLAQCYLLSVMEPCQTLYYLVSH